jgi:arylsulfatase I/J
MARHALSPRARGYDTWFGYWHHSNDYWSFLADDSKCPDGHGTKKLYDLWRQNATFDGPMTELLNGPDCGQGNQTPPGQRCIFEEELLTDEVKRVIETHNPATPLFLFWSMHLVHMPLEVPQPFLDKFANIDNDKRRLMHAMVNYMDTDVGEVVDLLHTAGLWNDSLVVFHADNGGEILDAACGGNNWPLRGGKFSNWQGGIRVNSFVTGGVLPAVQRGRRLSGSHALIAGWD